MFQNQITPSFHAQKKEKNKVNNIEFYSILQSFSLKHYHLIMFPEELSI